jgi:hypothetical protein
VELADHIGTQTAESSAPDWSSVEARIRTADVIAEHLAEHLWCPGDRPHHFDYVEEANSRGLRRGKLVPAQRRPTSSQLKASQIRYYRNPLHRLIRMHASFQELIGFAYRSPWPRQDGGFR